MNKRVFLHVYGEDYSALDFNRNYNTRQFYDEMVAEGVTFKIIEDEDKEIYAEVKIVEFGEIDDEYINYVKNHLCDYDALKDEDMFEVK